MTDSILNLIDGEDIFKQEQIFSTAMVDIEKMYPDFFINQPDLNDIYEHNKLHNYISWDSEGAKSLLDNKRVKQINLSIKPDLPEEIKNSYIQLVEKRLKEFTQTK